MADIDLSNTNPIPLTAIVNSIGGNYIVQLDYGTTNVSSITDTFTTLPPTVTVIVTSTTVPSGYSLTWRGDGSWTADNSSTLTGVFTVVGQDPNTFEFTILVSNGATVLARVDPRLIVKKLSPGPR
jgi:hypothetical protein